MSRVAWQAPPTDFPVPARAREDSGRLSASIAAGLTLLSVALLYFVSPMLLLQLGYNYEFAGGSAIEKMHPGTLVAGAAIIALLLAQRHPLRFLGDLLARHLGMTIFAAIWCVLLVYLVMAQKSPFTPIIDTFLLPMMLFALIITQRDSLARPFELFLHGFMIANALLGLFEVMSGWRLTPYTAGGILIVGDWRATALLGHPLANASLTGCYLLILLLGGGAALRGLLRVAALLIAAAAMVAFGGRAATILLLLIAAPILMLRGAAGLAFGRTTPWRAAGFMLAALVIPIALISLADLGAFDLFISRFIDDQGSAGSRVAMFELFDTISWTDLLIGPDPDLIATLKQIEGLEFGIESFWIASTLAYGLIMATIVFIGLFLFCRDLVRATRPATWWLLAYFFAVASTSVSLSAKTAILALVVAMAMAMLAPRDKSRRSDTSTPYP